MPFARLDQRSTGATSTIWAFPPKKAAFAVAPPSEVDVKAYALIVALNWQGEGPVNYAILRRLTEQLEDRMRAVEILDTEKHPPAFLACHSPIHQKRAGVSQVECSGGGRGQPR